MHHRDGHEVSRFRQRLSRPLRADVIIEQCRKYIYREPDVEVKLYNEYTMLWAQRRQSYSVIESNVAAIDIQISSSLKINENFGLLYTGVVHNMNEDGSVKDILYQLDILDASALRCESFYDMFIHDTIRYISKMCDLRTLLGQDDYFIYMDRDVFLQSGFIDGDLCINLFENAKDYCQDHILNASRLRFACIESHLKEEIGNEFKRYAVSAITSNSKQLPLYILVQEIITIMNI